MVAVDDIIRRYLSIVDFLASLIPYKRIELWKKFFLDPKKVLAEIGDVKVLDVLIDLYVITLVMSVVYLVFGTLPQLVIQYIMNPQIVLSIVPIFIMLLIIEIFIFIISPLISLLYSGFEFIIAKLLGGIADFRRHFFVSVMPQLGFLIILLPLIILSNLVGILSSLVPSLGTACACIFAPFYLPVSLFLWLYSIYIKVVALREIHNVSTLKAIGIIIIPFVIILIAFVILLIVFSASIISMWRLLM